MLNLSCKKATELLEKKESFKLSQTESLKLFLHISMCNICRNYKKQSVFLKMALIDIFTTEKKGYISIPVPENLESEIIEQIEKRLS